MKDSVVWEIDSNMNGSKFSRSSNSIHLSLDKRYGGKDVKVEWPCSTHIYSYNSVEKAIDKFIELCKLAKNSHERHLKERKEWDKARRMKEKEKKTIAELKEKNNDSAYLQRQL